MKRKRGRPKLKTGKKRSTTLYIDPAQRRALARLGDRRGVSMGNLIREAISLLLTTSERKKV